MKLETPDLGPLMAAGFKFPEPFTVKADDGVTDLYGVMHKPFDFDLAKKYRSSPTSILVRRPKA